MKTSRSRRWFDAAKRRSGTPRTAAAALAAMVLTSGAAWGQNFREWTGTGTDWSNNSNWTSGGFAYGQLEWKGGGNQTSNNNFDTSASAWRLFFTGSKSYTIGGNEIKLFDNGGNSSWILSQSSVNQVINAQISFSDSGARSAWLTTQSSGTLTLSNISIAGAVTELRIASNQTAGAITINGIITGDGKPVVIGRDDANNAQANTLVTFAGSNSYSGGTTISAGRLQLGNGGTSGSAGAGNIDLSGGTLVLNRSDSPTFANAVNATSGGNRFVEVASGTSATLSGVVTGSGEFWKSGTGTLTLTNASNNFSNSIVIQAGVLRVNSMANLGGSGNLFIGQGGSGTFSYAGSGSESTAKLGTFALQGGTSNTIEIVEETANLTVTSNIGQTDSGKSLTKTGSGTLTLTGTNNYSGATAVNQGTLVVGVNSNGSITSNVTVANSATLGGSGTITGNVTIENGGKLAAGNSTGTLTANGTGIVNFNAGSIFEWELDAPQANPGVTSNSGTYDRLSATSVTGAAAVFEIVLGSGDSFADAFWNSAKSWNNIFNVGSLASIFGSFSGAGIVSGTVEGQLRGTVADRGYFSFDGGTLNYTAIPEPTTALAGLLLAAGLLRRRR